MIDGNNMPNQIEFHKHHYHKHPHNQIVYKIYEYGENTGSVRIVSNITKKGIFVDHENPQYIMGRFIFWLDSVT